MSAIGALVMVDRIGKGIRTAPRDALISLSSSPKTLGIAFGVHRAMDTTGAMLGPLLAFGILALAPLAFNSVFLVSFCVALAGLGVIVLLVPQRRERSGAKPPLSLRATAPLLLVPRFRALVVAASLLGLATISDAFLYLALQRHLDLAAGGLPAAVRRRRRSPSCCSPSRSAGSPTGSAAAASSSAATCCCCRSTPRCSAPARASPALAVALALVGASYAATDGVLAALASATLDEEVRGSGLAVLTTATNLARFVASVGFGALWTFAGLNTAVLVVRGRARVGDPRHRGRAARDAARSPSVRSRDRAVRGARRRAARSSPPSRWSAP